VTVLAFFEVAAVTIVSAAAGGAVGGGLTRWWLDRPERLLRRVAAAGERWARCEGCGRPSIFTPCADCLDVAP